MDWVEWIKFGALVNICIFLLYLRTSIKRGVKVDRLANALHLRPGNFCLKAWWVSFLCCVSYRLGASASSSPEAIAYGMLPTLLLAVVLVDFADAKLREGAKVVERGEARRPLHPFVKSKMHPDANHPLQGKEVGKDDGPVMR